MFEDDSLTKKYFEVKANLRQNLMMEVGFGFGDENDDEQEKEEEFTNSNITKNDAIVEGDCDCGQQETPARDREKDWNGGHEESTNCQSANRMHTNSSLSGFFSPKKDYTRRLAMQRRDNDRFASKSPPPASQSVSQSDDSRERTEKKENEKSMITSLKPT